MKKVINFLLVISFFSCNKILDFIPLPSTFHFNKVYGGSNWDQANTIAKSPDNGYIIAGYTRSNDGDVTNNYGQIDAWVVKLNNEGHIIWQKAIGGTGFEEVHSIAYTQDGNYIMTGYTSSNDIIVSRNHGGNDAWVLKLDKSGKILWQKTLGGSGNDESYSIIEATDGGYIMAGGTTSIGGDVSGNHGQQDVWVVKLDKEGNKLWQKTLGGSQSEGANCITKSPDGGYLIAGWTFSKDGDVNWNYGGADAWIVKLDRDGNRLWAKVIGNTGGDIISSIAATSDNNYIMAGYTRRNSGVFGSPSNDYAWVVKIDKNGELLWEKLLGGSGGEAANSIIELSDGNHIMAGYTSSNDGDASGNHGGEDAWIIKLDKNGNKLWQKTLGGSANFDVASAVIESSTKHYVMAGYTKSNDGDIRGNHGESDAWVLTFKDQ